MSGLVISIGGLEESLKKAALGALLEYLQAVKVKDGSEINARESRLSDDILWVLQKYKRRDRVIIPTLKTIEILFSKRIFLQMEAQTQVFCAGVLESLAIELKGTKDFSKLYVGIAILGYIASILEPINTQAFSHLLSFLTHRYPKIRKACAEQVYLVLIQNEDLVAEENLENALEIVSECCWEGDMEEAKRQKINLCGIANIEMGQLLMHSSKISTKTSQQKPDDENANGNGKVLLANGKVLLAACVTRVTLLDLQSSGLLGSLSPSIGNLSFLRGIHLQKNSFSGDIPPEVGRLFRLRELRLYNNFHWNHSIHYK